MVSNTTHIHTLEERGSRDTEHGGRRSSGEWRSPRCCRCGVPTVLTAGWHSGSWGRAATGSNDHRHRGGERIKTG
ncbi:hypothetical protein M6B38_236930 [Iris pallida]|uniref:Uncharacterized protein n=1 Tax=Iris pallida TaxID=29817 RepID=A0AAX6DLW1_IRIPA|nr:hypothetical protein M6B38_236930 [Iris pallida]